MASMDVTVYFRTRRVWLARLAAYTGSERIFAWAVRLFRVQISTDQRRWRDSRVRAKWTPATRRIDLGGES